MIPDSDLDLIKAYCDAAHKGPWKNPMLDDVNRLVVAYRELRELAQAVVDKSQRPLSLGGLGESIDALEDYLKGAAT